MRIGVLGSETRMPPQEQKCGAPEGGWSARSPIANGFTEYILNLFFYSSEKTLQVIRLSETVTSAVSLVESECLWPPPHATSASDSQLHHTKTSVRRRVHHQLL